MRHLDFISIQRALSGRSYQIVTVFYRYGKIKVKEGKSLVQNEHLNYNNFRARFEAISSDLDSSNGIIFAWSTVDLLSHTFYEF